MVSRAVPDIIPDGMSVTTSRTTAAARKAAFYLIQQFLEKFHIAPVGMIAQTWMHPIDSSNTNCSRCTCMGIGSSCCW